MCIVPETGTTVAAEKCFQVDLQMDLPCSSQIPRLHLVVSIPRKPEH
jgi:hypothetical protein